MPTAPIPRVLVVDDFPQVRQAFGRFLTLAGMEASFAADGVEGLMTARASRPDLVLCDIEMPRMDGFGLLQAIKADSRLSAMPIILMTSRADPADIRRVTTH